MGWQALNRLQPHRLLSNMACLHRALNILRTALNSCSMFIWSYQSLDLVFALVLVDPLLLASMSVDCIHIRQRASVTDNEFRDARQIEATAHTIVQHRSSLKNVWTN